MMLAKDINHLVNCSISISPITRWHLYSKAFLITPRQKNTLINILKGSYYAEKYLGFPSEDAISYKNCDLTRYIDSLKDKNFLIVHGTGDFIVNPQHSMIFAKALIEKGILFQQLVSIYHKYFFLPILLFFVGLSRYKYVRRRYVQLTFL